MFGREKSQIAGRYQSNDLAMNTTLALSSSEDLVSTFLW